jgi:Hint domain/RTX calcium-binding nonapeptide repeat (4 copies)
MAVLLGTNGKDTLTGGNNADIIIGGNGNDSLTGNGGSDLIFGGGGRDFLDGGNGADILDGGAGRDTLLGGGGADALFGGGGADELNGGAGDDVITTGAGGDTVFYTPGSGNDIVTDFKPGSDVIDLGALSYTVADVNGSAVITVAGGSTITLQGVSAGDLVPGSIACFVRGTMIATPAGDRAVDTLSIGDEVMTVDGKAMPVKWVGRRAYGKPFLTSHDKVQPVLIKAGALAPSTPHSDLYVSPLHAMYVNGVLVEAQALVNGDSIVICNWLDVVEYFHVELEMPSVIISNGAASESYVNHDNRRMFANYAEYAALYGEEVVPEDGVDTLSAGKFRYARLVRNQNELDQICEQVAGQRKSAA